MSPQGQHCPVHGVEECWSGGSMMEGEDKPDYIDIDKDGDKKEPMKQAAKQAKAKKEKKVDETTVSGSVATASAAPKSSKGMQFGKGVYESLNTQYAQALTESIEVSEAVTEHAADGDEESITVTATGADVHRLKELQIGRAHV